MSGAAVTPPNWPSGPSCHGWLALDARGAWRLRGEKISHAGLLAFLDAHYGADDRGRWFVQNGAQRVFVDLEAAPLILRLHPEGALLAHTGKVVIPRAPVLLDENGNAFLPTSDGPGMIDDRDLATFVAALRCARGDPPGEAALLAMLVGEMVAALFWQGLAVESCPRADIAQRLGYQSHPAP